MTLAVHDSIKFYCVKRLISKHLLSFASETQANSAQLYWLSSNIDSFWEKNFYRKSFKKR